MHRMRFAYRMHPIFFPHSTTDFVSLRGFVTPRKEETLCSPDSPASHIQVVKKKIILACALASIVAGVPHAGTGSVYYTPAAGGGGRTCNTLGTAGQFCALRGQGSQKYPSGVAAHDGRSASWADLQSNNGGSLPRQSALLQIRLAKLCPTQSPFLCLAPSTRQNTMQEQPAGETHRRSSGPNWELKSLPTSP
jgi:hypothetical protein